MLKRLVKAASVLFICLLPLKAIYCQHDQEGLKGFTFKGTSNLTGYFSNQQGIGQETPPQYLLWNFRSQLLIYGVPCSFSGILTTMQNGSYQSINHLSFGIDPRALLLQKHKPKGFAFLRYFEALEVGRTRPAYSKLILNGVTLNGVNTAVNIKGMYAAFACGNTSRPVNRWQYWDQVYSQRLLYGSVGAGKKERQFIRLSVLHARDDPESLDPDSYWYIQKPDTFIHMADTFLIPLDSVPLMRNPAENLLCGVEGGVSISGGKIRMQGEFAGCATTSNTRGEELDSGVAPEWLTSLHQPRLSTSLSYAWSVSSALVLKKTRISASLREVAPGFQSPGVPFMRNDVRSYDLSGSHSFLKNRIMINSWMRLVNDNLFDNKSFTTNTTIYGLNTLWRPVKYPYISITWSPQRQQAIGDEDRLNNRADIITLSTGRNYYIKKEHVAFTAFTLSKQMMITDRGGTVQKFEGNHISLQQTLKLKSPVSFNAIVGVYTLKGFDADIGYKQFALMMNFHKSSKLQAGAGLRTNIQSSDRYRIGALANLLVDFGRYGKLSVVAEPLFYQDKRDPDRSFNHYIIRTSFVTTL